MQNQNDMIKEDKIDLNLLISFHEQFAENQNNHQRTFIQIISIFLTVIVGFGFAFILFGASGKDTKFEIGILEFSIAMCISEMILCLGVAILSSLALGFRRDQLVLFRIRKKAKITICSEESEWKIFPKSYNPYERYYENGYEKSKLLPLINWMPNFHVVFTLAFLTLQGFVILIYFLKLFYIDYSFSCLKLSVIVILVLSLIFFLISPFLIFYFRSKIKEYYKEFSKEDAE